MSSMTLDEALSMTAARRLRMRRALSIERGVDVADGDRLRSDAEVFHVVSSPGQPDLDC